MLSSLAIPIPDLQRPDVVVRRAAVHWQNARAALSLAIQFRDVGYAGRAAAAFHAARQCADLASFYRRRLVRLVGAPEAATANALHRSGVVS